MDNFTPSNIGKDAGQMSALRTFFKALKLFAMFAALVAVFVIVSMMVKVDKVPYYNEIGTWHYTVLQRIENGNVSSVKKQSMIKLERNKLILDSDGIQVIPIQYVKTAYKMSDIDTVSVRHDFLYDNNRIVYFEYNYKEKKSSFTFLLNNFSSFSYTTNN